MNAHLENPTQLALFRGADRWVHRQTVPSSSTEGKSYVVASDAAGRWGCSCPAWIYDPTRPACKHIRAARGGRSSHNS